MPIAYGNKRKSVQITYQSFPLETGDLKRQLCERRTSDVLTRNLNLNGCVFKVNRFDAKKI